MLMKRLSAIVSIGLNLALGFVVYYHSTQKEQTVVISPLIQSTPLDIWEVVRISDGDTIAVRQGNEERRVRLCGVDTPEKNQPGGTEATEFTRNAIAQGGNQAAIDFIEIDKYGRWIGEVWVNPGKSQELLNSLLIVSGNAWPYKQYWKNCPNRAALESSEQSAEQYGVAPWRNGAIAPWDWRKQKP